MELRKKMEWKEKYGGEVRRQGGNESGGNTTTVGKDTLLMEE